MEKYLYPLGKRCLYLFVSTICLRVDFKKKEIISNPPREFLELNEI